VATANYGEPGPSVTYRILKAAYPSDLLDAGTATQSRGGVIISLQDLGIAANSPIYGYSLFSSDLPGGATPANLINYNNATYFPINTGNAGGIDLVAVTGIYISNAILPTRFISFDAVENNNNVNLKWAVENETSVKKYEIERSTDGINYFKVNEIKNNNNAAGSASYTITDNINAVLSNRLYYRIKQYDLNESFYYSKVISLKRNNKAESLIIYPNPATTNLFVNIPSTSSNTATVSITDAVGAQVIVQQVQLVNGNNSFTIDNIDRLSKGVYQISVKWKTGKIITKQFSK
jgi:hypothetical protein